MRSQIAIQIRLIKWNNERTYKLHIRRRTLNKNQIYSKNMNKRKKIKTMEQTDGQMDTMIRDTIELLWPQFCASQNALGTLRSYAGLEMNE